jgi:hypothetical protein
VCLGLCLLESRVLLNFCWADDIYKREFDSLHTHAIVGIFVTWDIFVLCHVVFTASHRFLGPNRRPPLNSDDQKESIGTIFVPPALKLGFRTIFRVSSQ